MNSIEPKIAVYSIALNEEKHVRRWYESAREADLVLLADTGSSDKTIPIAKSLGVTTYSIDVNPWRFDVARNASLALIPEDYDICIQLDLDEVLPEGWRGVVTQAWRKGNYWPTYKHVTSRYTDGKARDFQHYFKIHPRNGFFWKYPIHETLVPNDGTHFSRELIDLEVDHLKDHSKSRGNYLHLLELAVSEMPNDWRMNHYLCREYMYNRNWLRVLQTAYASLELTSTWDVEAASTCMWASEAAWNLGMKPLAKEWAQKGSDAAPNFYEAWHWRAHIAHLMGEWQECFVSASKIDTLTRHNHHLVKPEIWEWWGYDLMALSAHRLGNHQLAVLYGSMATEAAPSDKRLKTNLEYYTDALRSLEQLPGVSP